MPIMRLDVLISAYMNEDGVYVTCDDQEELLTFFQLANDFIESHLVPSNPPSIRQDGKDAIFKLSILLEALALYMRKKKDEYPDWQPKEDSMGYRD
jgi:hypothetical protein